MKIIQKIQEKHYVNYVSLISSQLGEGYFTEADFVKLDADPMSLGFEATDNNGDVLGIITAMTLPHNEAVALLKISPENLPEYAKNAKEIGIFKTIAVSQKAKGKGIGSALTKQLLESFKQQNISVIACVAWKYGETENIKGVMKAFDFKCFQEIPDYWVEDINLICPACKVPPCHCQANIYFKQI